MGGLKWNS